VTMPIDELEAACRKLLEGKTKFAQRLRTQKSPSLS